MKKKIAITFVTLAVTAAAILTLSSFTSHRELPSETHTHVSCQGKHCTGTVGCDCTGFSAITDGKEWQKSYCKKCGHHKSYHK